MGSTTRRMMQWFLPLGSHELEAGFRVGRRGRERRRPAGKVVLVLATAEEFP